MQLGGIVTDQTEFLADEQDTKQLLSRLLYLVATSEKRKQIPNHLREAFAAFLEDDQMIRLGEHAYSYQDLIDLCIEDD